MEKVNQALIYLNKTIKGPFLAGNKVSFADFVVFGQLTDMLVLRRSLKEHEKVQQFFDSMMDQPGVAQVLGTESDWQRKVLPKTAKMFKITELAN